jgi:olfactory receptor
MYFFFSNLSFMEICYSSTTAPKLILDLLAERRAISLWGCMTRSSSTYFFGELEMFLLTVMAYYHYVAICKPLHYTSFMNRQVCAVLMETHGQEVSRIPCPDSSHFPLAFCDPNVTKH